MAEFLLQLIPRNGYIEGDPVHVMENGSSWGKEEDKREWIRLEGGPQGWPGNYVILQITDMTLADGQALLESSFRAPASPDELIDGGLVKVHEKPWNFHLSEMPAGQRNALIDDGFFEILYNQARAWFRHKDTDETI